VSRLQLRIFDGTRHLFSAPAKFLVTITDGNRTQHIRDYYPENDITFDLPFFDNFGDDYSVVVWAEGYKQAGFVPVTLSDQYLKTLDIMLISDDPGFSFLNARWDAAKVRYPFLGSDVDNATGLKRGISGTYVSVEPFHLFRYLDEQTFRYNHRVDMNDGQRFDVAVRQIVGKRLTYKSLTGDSGDVHEAEGLFLP
jgi:hypothetical protein